MILQIAISEFLLVNSIFGKNSGFLGTGLALGAITINVK